MKRHLFYTFLLIFAATAGVTLLGITNKVTIDEFYLKGLFGALLIELTGAVIGFFKSATKAPDFFSEDSKDSPKRKPDLPNHSPQPSHAEKR